MVGHTGGGTAVRQGKRVAGKRDRRGSYPAAGQGVVIVVGLLVAATGSTAIAGGGERFDCPDCRPFASRKSPGGDTGCGPRYWGAYHSEPLMQDPCDCSNRWANCCGGREMPEKLTPWQLPPCRGFQPPSAAGYGPVRVCRGCKTPTAAWW